MQTGHQSLALCLGLAGDQHFQEVPNACQPHPISNPHIAYWLAQFAKYVGPRSLDS